MKYLAKYDKKKVPENVEAVPVWEVCDKKFPDGVEVEVTEKEASKIRALYHFSVREVAEVVVGSVPAPKAEVRASK